MYLIKKDNANNRCLLTEDDIFPLKVPAGTVVIPEYGEKIILEADSQIILPWMASIQLLPGTWLQDFDHPENCTLLTEPINVYLRVPPYTIIDTFRGHANRLVDFVKSSI
jgi:hypothetical protein